jgi:hypothetical protein
MIKHFRSSAQILSMAKEIYDSSKSTSEAISRLQELIDSTMHCNLTAKELLSYYR